MEINDLAFYNIVVFTTIAELKFDPTSFTSAKVMHPKQITRFIHNEIGRKISTEDVNKILVKLSSIKDQDFQVQREIKKNHVKKIRESKNIQHAKTKLGQCPKCGHALTSRKGKYGTFMGCSNYPKCRYTSAS
ncbi:topoisomerase DNA-binding C4 zinc finger domain-containing protein [Bacillus sp. AK128]